MTGNRASAKSTGATALRGLLTGVVGYLISIGAGGLLLAILGTRDPADGAVTRLLTGSARGLAVAVAAAVGVPVGWHVPELGLSSRFVPWHLLSTGSPLVLLVLAPVAGICVAAWRTARTTGPGRRRVSAWLAATAGYALTGVVMLLGTPRSGMVTLEASSVVWAAAAAGAMLALGTPVLLLTPVRSAHRAALSRRRRVRVAALLTAVVPATLLTLSAPAQAAPSPVPGGPSAGPARPAPAGYRRPGVPAALDALRQQSSSPVEASFDPWRGTPSVMSLHAPLGRDALSWLDQRGALLGVAHPAAQLAAFRDETDELGQRHIWYQQQVSGVPVFGHRIGVHLDRTGRFVDTVTNQLDPDVRPDAVRPTLSADGARAAALRAVPGGTVLGQPTLMLYPDNAAPGKPTAATLTWQVTVRSAPVDVSYYFVGARGTGRIAFTVPASANDKRREVFDFNNDTTLPVLPKRTEGQGPSGIADVDNVYDRMAPFYDYYKSMFGRDSWDDKGAILVAWTRFREKKNEPFQNAGWDTVGQVAFGEGMVTQDIVGHEFTHAVVQYTADLLYLTESGALNESYADIFGESIEKFATGSMDWLLGEGSAAGVIRSMEDPARYGQPANLKDYQTTCFDAGGVHTNSGIPNHAYYLLVQKIGIDKAARIAYRALSHYLGSVSGFTDARNTWIQSAWDLYGKRSTEATEVANAWNAVGVDGKASAPEYHCLCFLKASLAVEGQAFDPDGPNVDAVSAAMLHTYNLFLNPPSKSIAAFSRIYFRTNDEALDLSQADPQLELRSAHLAQSLEPVMRTAATPDGDTVMISQALVDEVVSVMQDYIAASRATGTGGLAALLEALLTKFDPQAVVGMTVNQAQSYLDSVLA
jgi:Zn-dependent metalloprotease